MLSIFGEDGKDKLVSIILDRVWRACKQQSDSLHRDAVWQATALLIHSSEFDRKLLHAIAWSQVELFSVEAMRTAVECWRWLITSKSDMEMRFLQEMVAAWKCTVHKKLGLFSVSQSQTSPLAVHEGTFFSLSILSKCVIITPKNFLLSHGLQYQRTFSSPLI